MLIEHIRAILLTNMTRVCGVGVVVQNALMIAQVHHLLVATVASIKYSLLSMAILVSIKYSL
jgi:hypothetical protein